MRDPPQLMLVVGGFNSSNTNHLAHLCSAEVPTFHIETADGIDPDAGTISYKDVESGKIITRRGWLPEGDVDIGLTAGASTPDSLIGQTVDRILATAGLSPADALEAAR